MLLVLVIRMYVNIAFSGGSRSYPRGWATGGFGGCFNPPYTLYLSYVPTFPVALSALPKAFDLGPELKKDYLLVLLIFHTCSTRLPIATTKVVYLPRSISVLNQFLKQPTKNLKRRTTTKKWQTMWSSTYKRSL